MSRPSLTDRAYVTGGQSNAAIHRAAAALLDEVARPADVLVDVGCGTGAFRAALGARCRRYIGADAVRHPGLASDVEVVRVDLDLGRVDLPDASADIVTCLETIEHVENPRALARELFRLARPGGWLLLTTPNQLSLASKLSFLGRNEFLHFQERPGLYPAHITALLEIDLRRILQETGCLDLQVRYTGAGRIPFSARSWPNALSQRQGRWGRSFSDNVLIAGRKPR